MTDDLTPPHCGAPAKAPTMDELEAVALLIIQDVAELPDRTSPDDAPDMMLVSSEELHIILTYRIESALSAARPFIERETIDALNQPGSLHAHMLRGVIKPLPLRDCLHFYTVTAKDHWGALTVEQAMEIADTAIKETIR